MGQTVRTLGRRALAVLVLVALSPTLAVGQVQKAGVITTLEGNVTVRRVVLPQPVTLKFKDDVFFQDTVTTGDRSLARMLLGGKSIVTIRERSVVKITEFPNRSLIELEAGKVGLAVARDRMVPGESVDLRTPTAVVGVRGTVVVAEVLRATTQAGTAGAGVTTNFFMLRGSGEVRRLDPATGAPVGPPVTLTAMQQVSVTGTSVRVAPIPPGQVAQVTAGLESTGYPHNDAGNQEQVKSQVVQATAAVLGATAAQGAVTPVSAVVAAALAAAPVVSASNPALIVPPVANASKAFPERLIENQTANLVDSDRLLVSGGAFSRSLVPSPVQVLNSAVTFVGAGINSLLQVDGAGTTVNLAGGLATIAGSTIDTSGTLFVLSNGARLNSTVGSTTPQGALIAIDPSTITSARAFAAMLNQAVLILDGPFVAVTDSVLRATNDQVTAFLVINGASLITTSGRPVFDFLGTAPGRSQVTAARNLFALAINTDFGPAIPASMTLTGELLAAVNTDFTVGDPTKNVYTTVFVGDGSVLTSASPKALLFFQGSNVNTAGNVLTLRRSLPGVPSQINLAGPLFAGNGSTFNTTSLGLGAQFGVAPGACCDGFFIAEGAVLTSSTTLPLLQLTNSSFNAGPDAQSGGNFVNVADRGADPATITAPANVVLNGPLFSMDGGNLTALFSLLRVSRSNFLGIGTDGLIQAVNATINLGGLDPISGQNQFGSLLEFRSADTAGTAATDALMLVSGPFLQATNSRITATNAVLNVHNGAQFVSVTPLPLIALTGTTLNLGLAALGSGRVLNVFGTGGSDGVTPASVFLNGALLVAGGGSTIDALQGLVLATDGQILASGADSFVKLTGGTHSLASAAGASMFFLGGVATAPTANEIVDGVTLTLGTFAPLVWSSGDRSLFRLEGGASVSGQKAFRIDTALFEATAPVFDLVGGSSLTVAPTTTVDGGLMDLNARAKVTSVGPVARLDGSTITVSNNHAFRVAGGSALQVVGDFLSLNNGSVLQALNGSVMRVTGGSVVNISGAFAIFGVGANQIRVTNALCGTTCLTFSGIPIALTNNASTTQITVTGNALKNAGPASIAQSGPAAAVIVVDGTTTRLTIKGQ